MQDVQSSTGTSRFAIESVGVTDLNYPILVLDAESGEQQTTVAAWRMGVALPASQRGTHMSRFVGALAERAEAAMDLTEHFRFASAITSRLAATQADLQTSFTWFRRVQAPVSGLTALLECQVRFISMTGANPSKCLVISAPAKALCPCSKAISERGAHSQRTDIEVRLTFPPLAKVPAINHVVSMLEASASSPVYPLLKREDEKYVTEAAYDHAMFVEDIVRAAADRLVELPGLAAFVVQAVNHESIHAHDCYARITWHKD